MLSKGFLTSGFLKAMQSQKSAQNISQITYFKDFTNAYIQYASMMEIYSGDKPVNLIPTKMTTQFVPMYNPATGNPELAARCYKNSFLQLWTGVLFSTILTLAQEPEPPLFAAPISATFPTANYAPKPYIPQPPSSYVVQPPFPITAAWDTVSGSSKWLSIVKISIVQSKVIIEAEKIYNKLLPYLSNQNNPSPLPVIAAFFANVFHNSTIKLMADIEGTVQTYSPFVPASPPAPPVPHVSLPTPNYKYRVKVS